MEPHGAADAVPISFALYDIETQLNVLDHRFADRDYDRMYD